MDSTVLPSIEPNVEPSTTTQGSRKQGQRRGPILLTDMWEMQHQDTLQDTKFKELRAELYVLIEIDPNQNISELVRSIKDFASRDWGSFLTAKAVGLAKRVGLTNLDMDLIQMNVSSAWQDEQDLCIRYLQARGVTRGMLKLDQKKAQVKTGLQDLLDKRVKEIEVEFERLTGEWGEAAGSNGGVVPRRSERTAGKAIPSYQAPLYGFEPGFVIDDETPSAYSDEGEDAVGEVNQDDDTIDEPAPDHRADKANSVTDTGAASTRDINSTNKQKKRDARQTRIQVFPRVNGGAKVHADLIKRFADAGTNIKDLEGAAPRWWIPMDLVTMKMMHKTGNSTAKFKSELDQLGLPAAFHYTFGSKKNSGPARNIFKFGETLTGLLASLPIDWSLSASQCPSQPTRSGPLRLSEYSADTISPINTWWDPPTKPDKYNSSIKVGSATTTTLPACFLAEADAIHYRYFRNLIGEAMWRRLR